MKIKNITVLISGLAANQRFNSKDGIDEVLNQEFDTSDDNLFNHCEVLSLVIFCYSLTFAFYFRNTLNTANFRLVMLKLY